jgi:hypothetical protein
MTIAVRKHKFAQLCAVFAAASFVMNGTTDPRVIEAKILTQELASKNIFMPLSRMNRLNDLIAAGFADSGYLKSIGFCAHGGTGGAGSSGTGFCPSQFQPPFRRRKIFNY